MCICIQDGKNLFLEFCVLWEPLDLFFGWGNFGKILFWAAASRDLSWDGKLRAEKQLSYWSRIRESLGWHLQKHWHLITFGNLKWMAFAHLCASKCLTIVQDFQKTFICIDRFFCSAITKMTDLRIIPCISENSRTSENLKLAFLDPSLGSCL